MSSIRSYHPLASYSAMHKDSIKPRDVFTEKDMKEALDACAQEPIHVPGSIQPHGMLMVCSLNGDIEQISANAEAFLGVPAQACLGRNVREFIEEEPWNILMELKSEEVRQPIQSTVIRNAHGIYDAIAHQVGQSIVVEWEPVAAIINHSALYNDGLRNFAIGMHYATTSEATFDHVTRSIRSVTGFDRVKLYRFDADWHGEVVAESRADFMPSYKGLHFPSSDIPEQARRLYTQNYLRLIANIDYRPVDILPVLNPATGAPLDLSLSALRSVSPVHIQYLDNIDVKASMSISILQNGRLWGLIACHHRTPLYVPFAVRHVSEIMGHIFSAHLSTLQDVAKREAHTRREELIKKMSFALDKHSSITRLLEDSHVLAIEALDSSALVVKAYVHVLRYGDAPSPEVIATLLEWLKQQGGETMFSTHDARMHFKGIPVLENLTGGILAVPISLKSQDYAIWFRRAMVEEVDWAGNPEKPLELTTGGYRLTPRSSFALWKQHVEHRAVPWSVDDMETARSIAAMLLESEKMSAQQANLAKSEFLATMSHEIRTPMNAVMGLSHILAESRPLTDRQRECIKTLQFSADGLLALINDLLDISKIESRSLELEAIPFSLLALLEEIVGMMLVRAREKGVGFHLEAAAIEGITFIGDPNRIRQVILNLCSNALKFTEAGHIHLSILREASAEPAIDKLTLQVRDTGIGIAPEKIDVIFHKFAQGDSSISRKYGGTGLGLSITKMLTEAMGGDISVTSTLGKGSEFSIRLYLPQATIPPIPNAGSAYGISPVTVGPRLLLVEDYEPNILVATTYIEDLGYGYDIARSGHEAVEKAAQAEYAVILMDVQMPGMNGFEATQTIRAHEAASGASHTTIIGMTAHALAGDRERCLSIGMDDYIAKPVNFDELGDKLKHYTEKKVPA